MPPTLLRTLLVVCLALAPRAFADSKEKIAVDDAIIELTDAARTQSAGLSKQGKYGEAAEVLEKVVVQIEAMYRDRLHTTAGERYSDQTKAAALYRARAGFALKATTDKDSASKLMFALLERSTPAIETANLSDPRVQAILQTLRKLDPKFGDLFGPRKVKVKVTFPRSDSVRLGFSDALVAELRQLGWAASPEAGDDEFQFDLSEGEVIDGSGGLMASSGMKIISCELIGRAEWRAKGKVEMGPLAVNKRGIGYPDIPESCIKSRYVESAASTSLKLLRVWSTR